MSMCTPKIGGGSWPLLTSHTCCMSCAISFCVYTDVRGLFAHCSVLSSFFLFFFPDPDLGGKQHLYFHICVLNLCFYFVALRCSGLDSFSGKDE